MRAVINSNNQLDELSPLLEDMKRYLFKIEQGCQELSGKLYGGDKSELLEMLAQIMEGLSYYQKLLKSVSVLLTIDFSETLCHDMSIALLFEQLSQIFTSLFEATENQDYSLLTDLIEYDLIPIILISQQILAVVQVRYEERAV